MVLAGVAEGQHGIVSHVQLAGAGISGASIGRRVAAGRLHRLHRGVYAVGHRPRTAEARWMAAVFASGPGTLLSHLSAAALWEIYDRDGARVDVTVANRSGRALPGIRVHRPRRLDPEDVTVRDGIPVTTVARTLVDLTDVLAEQRVRRALREAEFLGLLDTDSLSAAVERARGRRRLRALKNALEAHKPGQIIRSELEHRFQELLHGSGLPLPETNVEVKTTRRTYEIDCLWRREGVAVELDGRAAHQRAAAFEEDRARDAALSAVGLRPVRFTWRRISREGAEVLMDLAAMLRTLPP